MNKDNKKLVVETFFIKEALHKNLTLDEFLLLVFFDNSFDSIFNMDTIKKVLNMEEERILFAYTSLLSKNIIIVEAVKNEAGKISEKVSLDNFYKDILLESKEVKKEQVKEDIFSIFESELGRTLSAMDYELINAWIDSGFNEEMVIAALKEAVYNGVNHLNYIDKILFEWKKKGINNINEISKKYEEDDSPLYNTKILEFDWLDEN